MKAKQFVKSATVIVALLFSGALLAVSDSVSCDGSAKDQFGDGVEGAIIYSVQNPTIQTKTRSNGTYSFTGIQRNTPVGIIAPDGFSVSGSSQSQNLTSSTNTVNFQLHDDSMSD